MDAPSSSTHARLASHAQAGPRARPALALARPGLRRGAAVVPHATPPPPPAGRSFDEEDQLDTELSREMWRVDPSRARAQAARLDLLWSVGSKKNRTPSVCDCCGGAGRQACTWCRGTGAMMVGREVFCSTTGGCKGCPVCNAAGTVPCEHCKGTGSRAAWLGPGCPVE